MATALLAEQSRDPHLNAYDRRYAAREVVEWDRRQAVTLLTSWATACYADKGYVGAVGTPFTSA